MAPARKPRKPKKETKPEVSIKKAAKNLLFSIFVILIIVVGVWYFFFRGGEEAPTEFEVSNLTFSPSEVEAGEPVIISAMVKNVGDLEGTYTVELKIDGEIQETKDVTLAGGATETVSFMVTRDTSGTYTIGVNGLQRALGVLTPATGRMWINIYNNDYSYYDVSVFLNGEEIIHEDRFANGYWGTFGDQPFEVSGTYELDIEAIWAGGIDHWTDMTTKTFTGKVGDEPTHWYYGIEGLLPGAPDAGYVDGVWTKFYWIVIEYGNIGFHY